LTAFDSERDTIESQLFVKQFLADRNQVQQQRAHTQALPRTPLHLLSSQSF